MRTTILGIDTATSRGSVALARGGMVVATTPLTERGAHARDLLGRIETLLGEAGLRAADLRGVVATLGPGSFTGVRVGLATAKGLAYALDIGLAGLSTLEALARAAALAEHGVPRDLCAALEAGRGEVYAALFRVEDREPVRITGDASHRPADLVRLLPQGACVVGDAGPTLGQAAREAGRTIVLLEAWPSLAGPLALWGERAIPPGTPYDPGRPRPNYVRPSDAEAPRR